jgi:hypothetical protein
LMMYFSLGILSKWKYFGFHAVLGLRESASGKQCDL